MRRAGCFLSSHQWIFQTILSRITSPLQPNVCWPLQLLPDQPKIQLEPMEIAEGGSTGIVTYFKKKGATKNGANQAELQKRYFWLKWTPDI